MTAVLRPGTTAVIPVHTPRLVDGSLLRAVESVLVQEHPVSAVAVAVDGYGAGAAPTRQRALDMVDTEWTAFLDADDWWYPQHLRLLHEHAAEHRADYVYSWFDGNQPFSPSTHRGKHMDPAAPHHTTMTVLVRTELARRVGFMPHPDGGVRWSAEDWRFLLGCIERGARFAAVPDVTWHYTADGHNTSGVAGRWIPDRVQTDVTVLIPHIPPRRHELLRAVTSVAGQQLLPAAVAVTVDHDHAGAGPTRTRALAMAGTELVAPLDDDDEWEPNHLEEAVPCLEQTGADIVYTGCTPRGPGGAEIPRNDEWGRFGRPFDPILLRQRAYLPVTCVARRTAAVTAGGWRPPAGSDLDDWGFYLRALDAGLEIVHHPVITWTWHMPGHGTPGVPGNTSGLGSRW